MHFTLGADSNAVQSRGLCRRICGVQVASPHPPTGPSGGPCVASEPCRPNSSIGSGGTAAQDLLGVLQDHATAASAAKTDCKTITECCPPAAGQLQLPRRAALATAAAAVAPWVLAGAAHAVSACLPLLSFAQLKCAQGYQESVHLLSAMLRFLPHTFTFTFTFTTPAHYHTSLHSLPLPNIIQDNDAVKAGLSRYVKKKKLERIDTYIAPLLEAKGQLVRVGRVMREPPPLDQQTYTCEAVELCLSSSAAALRAVHAGLLGAIQGQPRVSRRPRFARQAVATLPCPALLPHRAPAFPSHPPAWRQCKTRLRRGSCCGPACLRGCGTTCAPWESMRRSGPATSRGGTLCAASSPSSRALTRRCARCAARSTLSFGQ